tara:strand:- start:7775 stop:9220 length:1446 start_codon:yes stop_codon:yes gene_type:complete
MSETVIDLHTIDNKGSVNHGGGLELLMNDKRQKSQSIDIGLGELSELENELNTLTDDINVKSKPVESGGKSGLFTSAINSLNLDNFSEKAPSVTFEDLKTDNEINLGTSTAETGKDTKTWDGYGKFNNIPTPNPEPQLTKEELLREKFKILKKLEDLERKGANLSKKYTMEDPLNEMQGEYEMLINEKEKSNSIKFQGKILMAAITGLEFLNNKFDPFDLKMDGWAEQVNENVNDYDEIFAELHEKYKSKAKMAPELKLLFQLGGSAIMVHMTNTMFKSAIPGMDEIMRQNPELMQQFSQVAVNSMNNTSPGFSGFMNNFVPGNNSNMSTMPNMSNMSTPQMNNNMPPPPPMKTQQPPKSKRVDMPTNRPDLSMARSQEGINVEQKFASINDRNVPFPSSKPPMPPQQSKRPEMKGPTDISDILSGIKTKQINIQQEEPDVKESSTISIQDLKELSSSKMPKSNKKGKKTSSERNTISLDI